MSFDLLNNLIKSYSSFDNSQFYFQGTKQLIKINHLSVGATVLNYLANPITPQAILGPAFPVFKDY
jgi:hypothetical protein